MQIRQKLSIFSGHQIHLHETRSSNCNFLKKLTKIYLESGIHFKSKEGTCPGCWTSLDSWTTSGRMGSASRLELAPHLKLEDSNPRQRIGQGEIAPEGVMIITQGLELIFLRNFTCKEGGGRWKIPKLAHGCSFQRLVWTGFSLCQLFFKNDIRSVQIRWCHCFCKNKQLDGTWLVDMQIYSQTSFTLFPGDGTLIEGVLSKIEIVGSFFSEFYWVTYQSIALKLGYLKSFDTNMIRLSICPQIATKQQRWRWPVIFRLADRRVSY